MEKNRGVEFLIDKIVDEFFCVSESVKTYFLIKQKDSLISGFPVRVKGGNCD